MAGNTRSITEIIDSMVLNSADADHILSNAPRWYIKKIATKGVVELTEKETAQIGSLILTPNDSNQITLPADYVKWLRVSKLIKETATLIPLAVDGSITTAQNYLLDNLGRILLDNNEVELTGSPSDVVYSDNNRYTFDYSGAPGYLDPNFYYGNFNSYHDYAQYYNINYSFVRGTKFREDPANGVIQLNGEVLEYVVLEYVINPLKNVGSVDDLEIDEEFGDALEKYIIKEIVLPRRSVSRADKEGARRDYREALMLAKINKLSPDISALTSETNLM